MQITCPKCAYERTSLDTAPEWQCPSCGIAYVKFLNKQPGEKPVDARVAKRESMREAQALAAQVRSSGAIKLAGSGIVYLGIIAFIFSIGGLEKIRGGPFAMIAMGTPGAVALVGLFEVVTGVSFTHASTWWDGLAGWQRGVLGIVVTALAFVLMMVGIVLFA